MVDIDSDVGGYRLSRLLGEGGFGTVHLGEHPSGQLGAVKVLHARHEGDAELRQRLAHEVELARKVSSPCTARLLDADPDADRPWVVTEYVEGRTLDRVVREEGPRTGGDLYRLAVSTATALAAIHAAGAVHHDLKPGNIMLAADGARVIDFGIARALEATQASASALIGTPRYMAPEQVEGLDLTRAIDLFAWGAVIVYAATGRDAFDGPSQGAVPRRVLTSEPDLGDVPENLVPVVARCLSKDPADRPSARELLAALLGYGPDEADRPDVLSRGEQIGSGTGQVPVPDLTRFGERERVPGRSSGRPGSFAFGREESSTPGELAEAMQLDWDGAVALLDSAPRRQALRRWLPEDSPARDALARVPTDPVTADVQVARLIAHLRPDLAPRHRDVDMTLSHLLSGTGGFAPWILGHTALLRRIEAGLLDALSQHHCQEPGHGCPPGGSCAHYRMLARDTAVVLSVADSLRSWSRGMDGIFEDDRFEFRPNSARLLSGLGRGRERDAVAVADLAVHGLAEGAVRERAREVVLRAHDSERRVVAICVRELSTVLAPLDRAIGGLRQLEKEEELQRRRESGEAVSEDGEAPGRPAVDGRWFFYGGVVVFFVFLAGMASHWGRPIEVVVLLVAAFGTAAAFCVSSVLRAPRGRADGSENGHLLQAPVPVAGFDHLTWEPSSARVRLERHLEELPAAALPGSAYRPARG